MARAQRLTVAIKEKLTSQLIAHAFTARSQKLVEAECALAQEIYDDYMDSRKIKVDGGSGGKYSLRKVVASLPAGWPEMSDNFKVELAGQMTEFDRYDGMAEGYRANQSELVGVKEVPTREQQKWPFQPGFSGHYAVNTYDASHDFSERASVLQGQRKDLKDEIASMRASTRGTLDTASTIQKLIVIWPEVEAFAAPFLQQETAAAAILPVVARERLNDALGLPPHARELETA